jgi:hypothetical protein
MSKAIIDTVKPPTASQKYDSRGVIVMWTAYVSDVICPRGIA